jgi:hypothetical protein
MKEILLLPTWKRTEYLWCALKRIRAQDRKLKIMCFSDRGEDTSELRGVVKEFDASLKIVPRHNYFGNSFCIMEAYRWAYECGFEFVHMNEDDAMQHPDCLDWHREQHALWDDIFCSCGWIFNHMAPITEDISFAPWFYAPSSAWSRKKLAQIVKHANPIYYNDMRGYVLETFPNSFLHSQGRQVNTDFREQDAVIQFCIEQDKSQVAWPGIAKIDHVGMHGYNKPHGSKFEGTLEERIAQVEELIADPYWRADYFGRAVVEREVGRELPPRNFKYRIRLKDGWESPFISDLDIKRLPKRINSVPIPADAEIVIVS